MVEAGIGTYSSMFCSARSGAPAAISPTQRQARDVAAPRPARGPGSRRLAADQLERARLRRVAAQQPGPLEVREMGVHRRRRGQADLLADLAHGRRVAVAVDVLDEVVPDLLLAVGEHGVSPPGSLIERVFDSKVETPADGVNLL